MSETILGTQVLRVHNGTYADSRVSLERRYIMIVDMVRWVIRERELPPDEFVISTINHRLSGPNVYFDICIEPTARLRRLKLFW
jgi:hypothetical protein